MGHGPTTSGRGKAMMDPKNPKDALEKLARIRADSDFLGEEAKVLMELGRNAGAKLVELDTRSDAINKLMKLNARSNAVNKQR
jgi:hypothetical protein